jgi:biopolymer transport protein ExbB
MLSAGVAQFDAPKDLIEEVMFEKLLHARTRLQRALPFIAVSAASAPLLGLLGTVTGIINTFKLLTVFGSGDVKMLSGGISEALITTEFGLIVAIPTLLSHAFLSRRARAVTDRMEQLAIAFLSELEKARAAGVSPHRDPIDARVEERSAQPATEEASP